MLCAVHLRVKFVLVESSWIKNRVWLDDSNIPEDVRLANTMNTFQMTTYPIFGELDREKLVNNISQVFEHVIEIEPRRAKYQFSWKSSKIRVRPDEKGQFCCYLQRNR